MVASLLVKGRLCVHKFLKMYICLQGFVSIAEVDSKGRARRLPRKLPIRADIRRALCFPGGSKLMVTHLNENLHDTGAQSIKMCWNSARKSTSSTKEFYSLAGTGQALSPASAIGNGQENLQQDLNGEFRDKLHGMPAFSEDAVCLLTPHIWENIVFSIMGFFKCSVRLLF